MPRPRTVEDEAVLAAAGRVVASAGPAGLTLAAVAGECGLSPAALIQRFESKRGLLLALARSASEGAGAELRAAAKRHRSPLRALLAGLERMSASVSSPEVMANQLAFLQIDLGDPDFHAHALAHARQVRAEIKTLLDAAIMAGELSDTNSRQLARAVQTTYNGALISWAIYRQGSLATWLRRDLETTLEAHRERS